MVVASLAMIRRAPRSTSPTATGPRTKRRADATRRLMITTARLTVAGEV
jgi:hypothetical protein